MNKLLIEISNSFINLSLDSIDLEIQRALEKIATHIGADRAYIFEIDSNSETISNSYEWCAQGILPQKDNLQKIPLEMFPEWMDVYSRGENFIVQDTSLLKEGFTKEALTAQEIKSLATLPMMLHGRCIGMLGFDAVRQKRDFEDRELDLLSLFCQMMTNVKQREFLEISNQESLLALKRAESMAKIGNWRLDLRSAKLSWSDEIYNIFEIDKNIFEPSYENFLAAIHPEDREMVDSAYKNSLITKEHYSITHRLLMRDGRIKYVQEQCESDFDADSKPLVSVGTVQDITRHIESQNSLRLAASVFTHTHEAIIITSPQNLIIDVNSSAERITGYSKEELIGKDPKILSSKQHPSSYFKEMWQCLNRDGFWSGEVCNRRKNSDIYTELITISAVKDDSGELQHYVGMFSDITIQKEQQKSLERIAHYDLLTGLPNRALLSDRLEQAMLHARRNKIGLALLFIDLDGFKEVNDTHGHDVGDKLLCEVADRMKRSLRGEDTVARLGGDEFVLVLSDIKSEDDTLYILQKLLKAVAQKFEHNGSKMNVSASIGVAFFDYDDKIDADGLLRYADQAMYQAKIAGKNGFYIFDTQRDTSIKMHHEKLKSIEGALLCDEFALYYQPKLNMRSGEVVGLEALIRWIDPKKGVVPPGEFLPAIEGTPLSVTLGEWVVEAALRQIQKCKSEGFSFVVSINIDAAHLLDKNFLSNIKELLEKYPKVNTSDFILEILETSALDNISEVIRVMQECQKLGIRFSLDDFGTGYSSLTYLKQLPASELKIDRSFVRDMLSDSDDLAILDGVIGLAQAFNRDVIAEGVEEVEQGEYLLRMGCEVAQGYLIASPMPMEKLHLWMKEYKHEPRWAGLKPMNHDMLPVLYAKVQHRVWVEKVILYAKGYSDEAVEQDHYQCQFGKWLYSLGKKYYGSHQDYERLKMLHKELHEKAIAILKQKYQELACDQNCIDELRALHLSIIELLQNLIES